MQRLSFVGKYVADMIPEATNQPPFCLLFPLISCGLPAGGGPVVGRRAGGQQSAWQSEVAER